MNSTEILNNLFAGNDPHRLKAKVIELTSKHCGVIGFKCFSEVEILANRLGLEIHIFTNRSGLWYDEGNKFKCLTINNYLNCKEDLKGLPLNYNYGILEKNEFGSYVIERLETILLEDSSYEAIKKEMETLEEIKNNLDKCNNKEYIILENHRYYETITEQYNEDVSIFALGVFVPGFEKINELSLKQQTQLINRQTAEIKKINESMKKFELDTNKLYPPETPFQQCETLRKHLFDLLFAIWEEINSGTELSNGTMKVVNRFGKVK